MIKALLAKDTSAATDKVLQELVSRLDGLSSAQQNNALEQLLVINQSAAQARNQLTGTANPNPTLILQGLVAQWQRLGTIQAHT